MGTQMAPNYANIFIGVRKEKFLETCTRTPFLYKRLIGDIYLILQHEVSDLMQSIDNLNAFHPGIKFTGSQSTNVISFFGC